MTDKNEEAAREAIASLIDKKQAELQTLFDAFELCGGTYEDETMPAKAEQKLLTGPKEKKRRKKRKSKTTPPQVEHGETAAFTINGRSIEVRARDRNLLEVLQACGSTPLSLADAVTAYGKAISNPSSFIKRLNHKLAVAGVQIANVPRQGWKLERLP